MLRNSMMFIENNRISYDLRRKAYDFLRFPQELPGHSYEFRYGQEAQEKTIKEEEAPSRNKDFKGH